MARIIKDKYIFGTVKVGERGQIVIPKEARRIFKINSGDLLLVVGDVKKGIAIAKVEGLKKYALKILGSLKEAPIEDFEEEIFKNSEESNGDKK